MTLVAGGRDLFMRQHEPGDSDDPDVPADPARTVILRVDRDRFRSDAAAALERAERIVAWLTRELCHDYWTSRDWMNANMSRDQRQ